MTFEVPILFLVFNRPDTTQKVLDCIKEIKPSKLFIAADGPRVGKEGEQELCETVRKLILDCVDWPCDVKTLFREKNLGCGLAVSSAITWFFDNVEEGIIIEDDVLPSLSFFKFCRELLVRYRNDERISMISGSNLAGVWKPDLNSYYFSYYGGIWGWATWKRAWASYDFNIRLISHKEIINKIRTNIHYTQKENELFLKIFDSIHHGSGPDTWDYQWHFTRIVENALSIIPAKNLTSNIGFSNTATHTSDINSAIANMPVYELNEPILHPPDKMIDPELEEIVAMCSGLRRKKKKFFNIILRKNVNNK